jgi:hypothetical protein
MFGSNTLPLLLLLLLSNNGCCNDDDNNSTHCGCSGDRSTLAMCLCLLCLMDTDGCC